jgi:divalent metal cation (Fe/Co/Zn/Cd) transporter
MAHRRKSLAVALGLNTAVLAAELAGGMAGSFLVDPLFALIIASVIVVTTLRTVMGLHRELLWPERAVCK